VDLRHQEQNREGRRPKVDNIQQVGPGYYIIKLNPNYFKAQNLAHFVHHL